MISDKESGLWNLETVMANVENWHVNWSVAGREMGSVVEGGSSERRVSNWRVPGGKWKLNGRWAEEKRWRLLNRMTTEM